jgi:hypothetical protein
LLGARQVRDHHRDVKADQGPIYNQVRRQHDRPEFGQLLWKPRLVAALGAVADCQRERQPLEL